MRKISTEQIISIASLVMSVLVTVITNDLSPVLRVITIGVIVVLALSYFLYSIISSIKIRNSISSTAIIAKSKKYIMYLYKISKANEKTLKKYAAINDLKAIEKLNKKIVKRVKGDKVIFNIKNSKFDLLKNKLDNKIKFYQIRKSENYIFLKSNEPIIKMSKLTNLRKSYEISQKIIQSICDINRILLQVEQHKLRIKLGKYVARYTDDPFVQIEAYTDYIGWTNILIGNTRKGYNAIMTAIGLIDKQIGDGINVPKEMNAIDFYKYLYLKARAYRHLGTTYYTYSSKDIETTSYLNKALEIVNNSNFIENFKDKTKYDKLKYGIENNLLLAKYYNLIECLKKKTVDKVSCTIDSLLFEVEEKINEVNNMKDIDKHRLIKLIVLKNQIIRANKLNNGASINIENINADLNIIKNIFNNNINFDDAMEVFINQKVQTLYDEVLDIIKN